MARISEMKDKCNETTFVDCENCCEQCRDYINNLEEENAELVKQIKLLGRLP